MGKNMQLLGDTLAAQMSRAAGAAVPTMLELGTINSNLSLTTDSISGQIPKGEYMVTLTLAGGSYDTSSTAHTHSGGSHAHSGGEHAQYTGSGSHTHSGGEHTHSGGAHTHRLPAGFRALQAGDRVLVAWCGNEPVVISVVTSS